MFIQVKEKGNKFFYAHEVFRPEEIEKAEPLDAVLSDFSGHVAGNPQKNEQDSIKWSDLYRSIIRHFKEGKPAYHDEKGHA
ncbi:MAG: hypothetical protein LBT00_13710 [Spirochaetaceae bacterium]|nr:hypothetical protein [Spirochaetaceae bacterium]